MSIVPVHLAKILVSSMLLQAVALVNVGWTQQQAGQDDIAEIEKEFQQNDELLRRILKLAGNKLLMEELEIVGAQSIKLRKFSVEHLNQIQRFKGQAFQLRVRELSGNLSDLEKQRLAAEKKQNTRQMAAVTKQSLNKLETILLAHQVRRLRQISLQQQLIEANRFADEFGMALELGELKLTPAAKKALEAEIKKHREEYYRQVKKLQSQAVAKILNSLSEVQTQKYKDLVGDHYDFDAARRRTLIKNQSLSR